MPVKKPAAGVKGASPDTVFVATYVYERETKGTYVFQREGLTKESRFSGSNSIYIQKEDYPNGPPSKKMYVTFEFV